MGSRSRIEYLDKAIVSKKVLKAAIDPMFEPNLHYYELRKGVKKKMAIDYKKEWEKLRKSTGDCTVIKDSTGTTLDVIMNKQIDETIGNREKLMEQYVKENIATEIDGGDKHFHHIKIVNTRTRGVRSPIGTMYIHKKNFATWCKEKEKKNE